MTREELLMLAHECQAAARYFAPRVNTDSTLTAAECAQIVKRFLNAGNVLETLAKSMPQTLKEVPT